MTLTKLTQLTQVRANWSQVVNTKTYQKYFGPSGPQFITAAQVERITGEITSELGYFQWQEGSPETYADLVKSFELSSST